MKEGTHFLEKFRSSADLHSSITELSILVPVVVYEDALLNSTKRVRAKWRKLEHIR